MVLYFKCSDVWKTNIGSRWDSWSWCQARIDGCEVVCSLLWLCWITFMEETWKLLMMKISWIKNRKETNHPIEYKPLFFFIQGGFRDASEVESTIILQYNKLSCIQVIFKAIGTVMNWTDISLSYNSSNYFYPCVMNNIFFLYYWRRARCHFQLWYFVRVVVFIVENDVNYKRHWITMILP